MQSTLRITYVMSLLLAAGCGFGESIDAVPTNPDETPQHCKQALRARFRSENGRSLQGLSGAAFVTQGARMGCDTVESLQLQGAELVGQLSAKSLGGRDFIGADLEVRDDSGQAAIVEVANVEVDPRDPSQKSFLYTLQYYDAQSATMKNPCVPDKDGVAKALPFAGSWGPDGAHLVDGNITFACTSGVIAKCARWGYRPYENYNGTSLTDYHQACTRMARADYCGDGTSKTKDGTPIDIYDKLGFLTRSVDLDPLLLFEASWSVNGAYCISKERWPEIIGLLSDTCLAQFTLNIGSTPVDGNDLCFSRRNSVLPTQALLNNRSY